MKHTRQEWYQVEAFIQGKWERNFQQHEDLERAQLMKRKLIGTLKVMRIVKVTSVVTEEMVRENDQQAKGAKGKGWDHQIDRDREMQAK